MSLLSGNVLAFMGDAVLSVQVREYLISKDISHPKKLQEVSTRFVSAVAQADFIVALMDENLLSDEELAIFKRGRNAKSTSVAKNADVMSYRLSTGMEALWGYLHMEGRHDRLNELFDLYIKKVNL